jgi:hypothetical protein
MKQYLKKIKAKMPAAPGKDVEEDDMLELDLEEGSEPEAGETKEHEAAESPEFEAGEHEEAAEAAEGFGGIPEGTPEEEAAETEEAHTAELSDEALLAEIKKRGLLGKRAPAKAVAVSKDAEEDLGY